MINEINKIINKYSDGEYTAEKANEELAKIDSNLFIDPNKNVLSDSEKNVVVQDITKFSGSALMNSGTGTKNKVAIKNGKLVDGVGKMRVEIIIGAKIFHVKEDGVTLF